MALPSSEVPRENLDQHRAARGSDSERSRLALNPGLREEGEEAKASGTSRRTENPGGDGRGSFAELSVVTRPVLRQDRS